VRARAEAACRGIRRDDGPRCEEAFELACSLRPALIVTDLQMPRLSGLELAIRLKRTPQTAQTPLLMLTARGTSWRPAGASNTTKIRHILAQGLQRSRAVSISRGVCAVWGSASGEWASSSPRAWASAVRDNERRAQRARQLKRLLAIAGRRHAESRDMQLPARART